MKLKINPNLEVPEGIGRVFINNSQKRKYIHISSFSTINKKDFPNSVEIETGRVDINSLMGIHPSEIRANYDDIKYTKLFFPGVLELPDGYYRVAVSSPDYNFIDDKWGTMKLDILRKISLLEYSLISFIGFYRECKERLSNYAQDIKNYISSI